jgi:Tfp pilus assembly protein PilV
LFKQIKKKLNSRDGESLAEVLVAVLIIAVGLVLISTMVIASGRMVDKGGQKMKNVVAASNAMEEQTGTTSNAQLDVKSDKTQVNATAIIQIKLYKYTADEPSVTLMSYSR